MVVGDVKSRISKQLRVAPEYQKWFRSAAMNNLISSDPRFEFRQWTLHECKGFSQDDESKDLDDSLTAECVSNAIDADDTALVADLVQSGPR
jgi:hypothetical protein